MRQHEGGHRGARESQAELQPVAPRVYVASLSDYNDGRLHGTWIDAACEESELYEQVEAILATSQVPGAEEWAIHDFEGFCGIELNEDESLETVAMVARGIRDHGPAFGAFLCMVGTTDAADADRFEDSFLGHFSSMEGYARCLIDELGLEERLDQLAGDLRPYVEIAYEALARDLRTDLDKETAPDGGVFVFDLRT